MARHKKTFTVGGCTRTHDIYGDRGNILTLLKRAEWRDFEHDSSNWEEVPLSAWTRSTSSSSVAAGPRAGARVRRPPREQAAPLERAVAAGAGVLAVCGGYQLLATIPDGEGERFRASA